MLKEELIDLCKNANTRYGSLVYSRLSEVEQEMENIEYSYNILEQIIEFEKFIIYSKLGNRISFEDKVLYLLKDMIYSVNDNIEFDRAVLDERLISDCKDNDLKKIHQISYRLLGFAKELFGISIPRDIFTTKRKGYAMGITRRLLDYYDLPDKFDLFIEALQSSKDKLRIEALKELHYYFESYSEEKLPESLIIELDKIILKTRDRYVASGALNLQVITGHIDEFEALSRIEDWKEKYYYND